MPGGDQWQRHCAKLRGTVEHRPLVRMVRRGKVDGRWVGLPQRPRSATPRLCGFWDREVEDLVKGEALEVGRR